MSATRTIVCVVGTRPNFMKAIPVVSALAARPQEFGSVLVHTGQHYDEKMSQVFLDELGIGPPDHLLCVGSGSHAEQAAKVMTRLEPLLEALRPDLVLVPGDVNSTMAAALVASKLRIPIGHIEAGLRSFDRAMPEEINRIVTDALSDLLFTHSPEAAGHLMREGRSPLDIYAVGNTMIDTLVGMRDHFMASDAVARIGVEAGKYVVVTLHRPALVDGPLLADVVTELASLAEQIPVVLPAHPRTRAAIATRGLDLGRVLLLDPLGYIDFLALVARAAGVLTDSGGIQEETTYLGIPCFTLRANTERPITCEVGTNVLLGLDPGGIAAIPQELERREGTDALVPDGWDGRASERLVGVLASRSMPNTVLGRLENAPCAPAVSSVSIVP